MGVQKLRSELHVRPRLDRQGHDNETIVHFVYTLRDIPMAPFDYALSLWTRRVYHGFAPRSALATSIFDFETHVSVINRPIVNVPSKATVSPHPRPQPLHTPTPDLSRFDRCRNCAHPHPHPYRSSPSSLSKLFPIIMYRTFTITINCNHPSCLMHRSGS